MATPNLPDLKTFLDIDVDTYDTELPTYLTAATQTVAHRCGPLSPTEVTEQVRVECGVALVSSWPMISATSALDDDGAALDVSGVKVDRSAGIVRGIDANGLVDLTYQAGYDPCPDDLELAVYIVAGHLWDTQRGRSGSRGALYGVDDDTAVGGDASYFVLQGFALPRRAMELTRPYIKAGLR